jgi:hypothetical protein
MDSAGAAGQAGLAGEGRTSAILDGEEVSFLLCVEANRLAPQARLLCESLRQFGGRYRRSPLLAVSPRPELALPPRERAELERLGVTYVIAPLNTTGHRYGTINRIVAGAWAEAVATTPFLVVLDSDTLLVAEPALVRADAGVRPVDVKGTASRGDGDPLEAYWQELCSLAGIPASSLPWVETTVDKTRVRAAYNGGFTVVRRDCAILATTRALFFATLERGLRPSPGTRTDIHASTGLTGLEIAEWWGASQAALAVAIWKQTADVHLYDARYNLPLHLVANGAAWPTSAARPPVLLHYHYLAELPHQPTLLQAATRVGCPPAVRHWLEDRLGYFQAD